MLWVMVAATLIGIYLCYQLAAPFMPALTWALALAILFAPLQRWLEKKLKRPSLAAAVCVLMIGLMVAVPLTFVGQQLVVQTAKAAALIESKVRSGEWREALQAQPRLAYVIDKITHQFDLTGSATTLASWLSTHAASILKGSVFQLIGVSVTFYLLFFFLRDRSAGLQWLRSQLPLPVTVMDQMIRRTADTVHATIYGLLAVSSLQGLLGGLMFWWLGLSAPLLWGVVMAVLAVMPVFGSFVIWIPAALFLAVEGSWGKALILTAWGIFVIGTADNLLRPVLVGNRLKLHTVLVFMSVVGGLLVFGAAGLILGPIALTLTLTFLELWNSHSEPESTG